MLWADKPFPHVCPFLTGACVLGWKALDALSLEARIGQLIQLDVNLLLNPLTARARGAGVGSRRDGCVQNFYFIPKRARSRVYFFFDLNANSPKRLKFMDDFLKRIQKCKYFSIVSFVFQLFSAAQERPPGPCGRVPWTSRFSVWSASSAVLGLISGILWAVDGFGNFLHKLSVAKI